MNDFYYFLADIIEANDLQESDVFDFLTLEHCFELLSLSADLEV